MLYLTFTCSRMHIAITTAAFSASMEKGEAMLMLRSLALVGVRANQHLFLMRITLISSSSSFYVIADAHANKPLAGVMVARQTRRLLNQEII